ncbi:MAG TPA: DUF3426 domain-containing protein [Gammaproteobacteria bacterium]|nr:DUF3426 domain-containing protein [Gammaproteobacteria bacterium]
MQTQCPHCHTRFRITETQLNMAEGYVRCGVCKEVFNAHEVELTETEDTEIEHNEELERLSADEYERQTAMADGKEAPDEDSPAEEDDNEDSYDLFDEEHNKTLTHVVPDHIRESEGNRSWLPTLLWSLGIILLTATLFLEYIWFNREAISRLPEIRDALMETCLQYDCSQLVLRDSSRIELRSRNVYSHPGNKQALKVELTIQNTSDFSQPWPLMQVAFSDARGQPVAARRFSPEEYLGSKPAEPIRPGDTASISMEIQDPGKQAVTYEFDFL